MAQIHGTEEEKKHYGRAFYASETEASVRCAREMVPIILDYVKPKSVVDFGCGVGAFLAAFREFGINEILGIDGSWIDKNSLIIPHGSFMCADLKEPISLTQEYDLAISLEVAEHIPEECADIFVDSLTRAAPIIVFSAAIPLQGGERHINEKWQDYWAQKFKKHGYIAIDCIRKGIWKNRNVDFYYAQNTILYAKKDILKDNPRLNKEARACSQEMLSLVHPDLFLRRSGLRGAAVSLVPSRLKSLIPPHIQRGIFNFLFRR